MPQALGLGDLHKIGLGQAPRLPQDRAGNQNVVIPRQPADQFPGRVAERRQAQRQLRACFRFDLVDQAIEDVVEQPHMLVVVQARAFEKQCGDPLERLRASPRRPMLDNILQLRNEGWHRRHLQTYTGTLK
jgi:hypothetical protein